VTEQTRRPKRPGVLVIAAACVVTVLVGVGVWMVGAGTRWLGEVVDRAFPDAAVSAAVERLEASAGEFARSLQRVAAGAYPTRADVAAAAAESGLAVAVVGTTPTAVQVWAVGVEREVPSEGMTEDVWSCFVINITVPSGSTQSGADVERIDCRTTDANTSLVYASRWLDQRHAAAELGRLLATESPAGRPVPSAGSVVDGLRVVAVDGDGTTVRADVVDEAGTVVLAAPDSYLYGVRLVAGPGAAGGSTVTAVRLPVEVDPAVRAQAEAEAIGLVESVWPSSPPLRLDATGVRGLNLDLGKLVAVVGYEATAAGLTLHLAVEVVAGGRRADNPAPSPIVVCVGVVSEGWGNRTSTRSIAVKPCGYPLVATE